LHAVIHGVSVHITQGDDDGSIIGVPAAWRNRAGARMIASTGHASMQSLQRVHPAMNATSFTAPGGR
jgi:hypothetical protein